MHILFHCTFLTESLDALPHGLLKSVDTISDRLVSKASQLVQNTTTNLSENFMSIRCKMDGGKFYNRIQSGSFQHWSMAAALRVQHGTEWLAKFWKCFSDENEILNTFSNNRKRQHIQDTARKVSEKYKKVRLLSKNTPNAKGFILYGDAPAEVGPTPDELQSQ